VTININL